MGTAIHTALLEPERFKSEYLALREVTDRRASAYKEAIKVHPKEKVLTGLEADKVIGMQESVLSNDAIKSLFTAEGWRELSLFVRHPDTGAIVRCRYDLITATGVAIDLKKTRDARPDAFSRAILNYEYDLQAALYADAFEWATGERIDLFFAAVEESMPHGVKLYRPDDTVLSEGRRKYKEGLQIFADSESAGDWPNLECTEPELIGLPAWRVNQIENELLEAIE
jgi:exodeoxyribonuclease VIII